MFKEQCYLRMLFYHLAVHVEEFCRTRHKHRQQILFLMLRILPIIFQNSLDGHLLQLRFQLFRRNPRKLHDLRQSLRLAYPQFQRDLCLLIRHHTGQSPILRVILSDLPDSQLLRNPVCHHLAQLHNALPRRFTVIGFVLWINVIRILLLVQFSLHTRLPSLL